MNRCFFFKQKAAYEMRISYWSSDVCSSDLHAAEYPADHRRPVARRQLWRRRTPGRAHARDRCLGGRGGLLPAPFLAGGALLAGTRLALHRALPDEPPGRSEEHTSALQSLMRISYDVFCLKKKTNIILLP